MANVIVSLIILSILAISISKIISEKRKGVKCIGCPHSKGCAKSSCGITIKK